MGKKSKARNYLNTKVKKPLEQVIKRVLKKRPDDPLPLIISSLEEAMGIRDDPLTSEERIELNDLRNEHTKLKHKLLTLREQKGIDPDISRIENSKEPSEPDDDINTDSSEDDDEEDDILPPLPEKKKGMNRKPRVSVSAEAFGTWNK